MLNFPCNQCGACCQRVDIASETRFLDRGDGTCRHFHDKSKMCSIYSERPEICRIDVQYIKHYSYYSWNEFVKLNQEICHVLESELKNETNLIASSKS